MGSLLNLTCTEEEATAGDCEQKEVWGLEAMGDMAAVFVIAVLVIAIVTGFIEYRDTEAWSGKEYEGGQEWNILVAMGWQLEEVPGKQSQRGREQRITDKAGVDALKETGSQISVRVLQRRSDTQEFGEDDDCSEGCSDDDTVSDDGIVKDESGVAGFGEGGAPITTGFNQPYNPPNSGFGGTHFNRDERLWAKPQPELDTDGNPMVLFDNKVSGSMDIEFNTTMKDLENRMSNHVGTMPSIQEGNNNVEMSPMHGGTGSSAEKDGVREAQLATKREAMFGTGSSRESKREGPAFDRIL